jgi:D-glycero-alpha-D-manno-heptose 1-phosphate guanylyltransferase
LVVNGDTFFDISFSEFLTTHIANNDLLTIALQYMDRADRYGLVQVEDSRIKKFEEKKPNGTGWINAGIYAINKSILTSLPEKYSWEQDFMNPQVDKIQIKAACFESYFIDIGVPEDYEKAQEEMPLLLWK